MKKGESVPEAELGFGQREPGPWSSTLICRGRLSTLHPGKGGTENRVGPKQSQAKGPEAQSREAVQWPAEVSERNSM